MKPLSVIRVFILFAVALLVCAVYGCGEKGPPLVPIVKGRAIAAPQALKASQKGEHLLLTWAHTVEPGKAHLPAESFDVFMAQRTQADCQGCPFEFKLAQRVPAPEKELLIKVKAGVKYYFRVQALGEADMVSPYSKTLQYTAK